MPRSISDSSCELLGDFFTIFANATRMRVFCALQQESKTVTEIADHAGVSIANASQHLRLMRGKGAVIAEKSAQNVYYRIADQRFLQAAVLIREALLDQMREKTRDASRPQAKRLIAETVSARC